MSVTILTGGGSLFRRITDTREPNVHGEQDILARSFIGFRRWGWETRSWSARTQSGYSYAVGNADRWLEEHRGTDIWNADTSDLRAWLSSKPPTPRTRNFYRSAIAAFYDWLVAMGLQVKNPVDPITPLKIPKSLPRALSDAETRKVWDVTIDDRRSRVQVALFLYAGLRSKEARELTWDRVVDGYVTVTGKGSADRALPIHDRLADALDLWGQECPDPRWLFPSPQNYDRPESYSTQRERTLAIGQLAGIEPLQAHALRHTFATRLIEAGVDVRTVQELLGHSNVSTTSVYLRARPSRLREAIVRLD